MYNNRIMNYIYIYIYTYFAQNILCNGDVIVAGLVTS